MNGFGNCLFLFQDNKVSLKQFPGHNHENAIFELGNCPLMHNDFFFQSVHVKQNKPNRSGMDLLGTWMQLCPDFLKWKIMRLVILFTPQHCTL